MRILYDRVCGSGLFAPGVTDAFRDMLQVSRQRPDGTLGKLCWRRVLTGRFGPFWLNEGAPWAACQRFRGAPVSFGAPAPAEVAAGIVRTFRNTLRRGGTMVVQLRGESLWGSDLRDSDGRMAWLVSVCHTRERVREVTNMFRPDGFPSELQ